ncbi:MAG: branched-chain amino acid ABC transporter permease, partial [Roseiarcus sp.]
APVRLARYLIPAALLAVSLSLHSGYFTNLLIVVALQALPAIGLSLLMGYTGQISLGHAAFYGLGAYGTALISTRLGLDPWLGIAFASALVGVLAWGLGWLVFRFSGHHLAMATLGFGVIVHVGMVELRGLTGGPNGLTGIPPLSLLGHDIYTDARILPVAWLACLLAILLAENLVRSPQGLVMRGVSENERVAASLGNAVDGIKRRILVVSAVFASVGGGIYAHYIGYLSPEPFDVGFSIKLLVIVSIGGFADLWGVLVGAAFITLIGELLKPLGSYDVVVYGVLLVGVIIFCPNGMVRGLVPLLPGAPARRVM